MKFKIITLGCKVNTYESELMREKLISNGFIETIDSADIVIVNTCSVTNMADVKSRKLIRLQKKENKDSIIIVCGCSAENHKDDLLSLGIDILLGNNDKSNIVNIINLYLKDHNRIIKFNNTRKVPFENMSIDKFEEQTRAYVKIQDGCNNFCSYCIIPYLRGISRSKKLEDVIDEVTTLVRNGYKEIVLTGIDTGSYGLDLGYDLDTLLEELVKIKGLKRLRLSSIDTFELTDRFLNILKNNDVICNHLHISLQSGSDKILKLMGRRYTTKEYLSMINKLRNIRPDISITTDVIVGFPGEDDEDFNDCLRFCREVNFSKIHVFPYSKRLGTRASLMEGTVDGNIKKERVKNLLELSDELELSYNKKFIGKEVNVLVEEVKGNKSIGHTSNYLKVVIDKKLNRNDIVNVKVYEANTTFVCAEVV